MTIQRASESAVVARSGAGLSRHRSRQDYATPASFILAVERRFGMLHWDLACSAENRKAPRGFTTDDDGLSKGWGSLAGNLWLNPPFADIAPWAEKLAAECRARLGFAFLLVPASIGSNWFAESVCGKAYVLGLAPRLTFEGASDPYPKDLMLAVYGFGMHGFDTWRWA